MIFKSRVLCAHTCWFICIIYKHPNRMFYKNMALKHAYNLSWGWTFNRGSPVLPCKVLHKNVVLTIIPLVSFPDTNTWCSHSISSNCRVTTSPRSPSTFVAMMVNCKLVPSLTASVTVTWKSGNVPVLMVTFSVKSPWSWSSESSNASVGDSSSW